MNAMPLSLDAIFFKFLKKFISDKERARKRETMFPSTGSFAKYPQDLGGHEDGNQTLGNQCRSPRWAAVTQSFESSLMLPEVCIVGKLE